MSFLDESDKAYGALIERRFKAWRRYGLKATLAISISVVAGGFYLRYRMINAAYGAATPALSASEMLELEPEAGHWFTPVQARLHTGYCIAMHMIFMGFAVVPPAAVCYLPLGGVVSTWRTVKTLQSQVAAEHHARRTEWLPERRPRSVRRGHQGLPVRYTLLGRPLLQAETRARLYYRLSSSDQRRRRTLVVLFFIMALLVPILLIWGTLPFAMAVRFHMNWYEPLRLLAAQYAGPGPYQTAHLLVTDKTCQVFFTLLILTLYSGAVGWTSFFFSHPVYIRYIKAMRRLDILLWRQRKGKAPDQRS